MKSLKLVKKQSSSDVRRKSMPKNAFVTASFFVPTPALESRVRTMRALPLLSVEYCFTIGKSAVVFGRKQQKHKEIDKILRLPCDQHVE